MKQMNDRALIYKTNIDLSSANNPKSTMINYINNESVVFDVGCACGDLGVALKAHRNATIFGLEYNQGSIDVALETGAYEEIHRFDLNELEENDFPQYKDKFDYVVCGDVLEHLRNPMRPLSILKSFLKKEGKIIASIPNVAHMSIKSNLLVNDFTYTPAGLLDETHIHFFTYKSIASELASINLQIEECKFTHQEKQGRQPNNPYPQLSDDIKDYLFKDWHSYVCQYVMNISRSQRSFEELLKSNTEKLTINESNAPDYIKNYRKQILAELTNTTSQKLYSIENSVKTISSNLQDTRNKINDKLESNLQEIKDQFIILQNKHNNIIENINIQFDKYKTLIATIDNNIETSSQNFNSDFILIKNQLLNLENKLTHQKEFELKEKVLRKKINKLKNRRKLYKISLFVVLLFVIGLVYYILFL